MKLILDIAVLCIIGVFLIIKLDNFAIGFLFIAASVILTLILLKDKGLLKSPREKRAEKEAAEKREKVKKLQKYDVDSGLEYCSLCGNYSVKEGRCESCGEKSC